MLIDGIKVNFEGIAAATPEEALNYIVYVRERVKNPVNYITVKLCDDGKVDVSYVLPAVRNLSGLGV